jgi:hypothetical protein
MSGIAVPITHCEAPEAHEVTSVEQGSGVPAPVQLAPLVQGTHIPALHTSLDPMGPQRVPSCSVPPVDVQPGAPNGPDGHDVTAPARHCCDGVQ